MDERIQKLQEKVKNDTKNDICLEEMHRRVILLNNLGIKVENLQNQKDLMLGNFEFVKKEEIDKDVKI